ncbi:MAG: AAA family ATPase [Ectothiorhodospiraceae bacterium]
MYLTHFGLKDYPFSLTPDTAYFYNRGAWQEALNVLLVALDGNEGFIKVTGEVGTGKTLLCRTLLNRLGSDYTTAWIPNPYVSANGLRLALADELGLQLPGNTSQHRLLRELNHRLMAVAEAGRPAVIVLDECQAMPDETLEALRLLTNLETERRKLLQVVMFGQPELDERLNQSRWRQLRQRITFSHQLAPLAGEELDGYVGHRLAVAGHDGRPLFTDGALTALHRHSQGVPRLVNILAHKALLAAYGQGSQRIGRSHVQRAVRDTGEASPASSVLGSVLRWLLLAVLLCVLAGVLWFQGQVTLP